MLKYPSTVPGELSTVKATKLFKSLPGFDCNQEPTVEQINRVLEKWKEAYNENLDKVMFDNLSSYEP